MKPGKVERREFEYIRHGTQTLIAAFDVVSGEVQGSVGDSRTEADFVAYLEAEPLSRRALPVFEKSLGPIAFMSASR